MPVHGGVAAARNRIHADIQSEIPSRAVAKTCAPTLRVPGHARRGAGGPAHQILKVMPTRVPEPSSLAVIDISCANAATSWSPNPRPGLTRAMRGTMPQP